VDGLVVIPCEPEIPVGLGQQSDQLHHDPGGVLEFVYEDVLEPPLVALQDFSVGFEEVVWLAEQVIEVQVSLAPLEQFIGGINLGKLLILLSLGTLQVCWRNQVISCQRDLTQNHGRILLQTHLFHGLLE